MARSSSRGLGSFNFPVGQGKAQGMGIQEIMPFVQQQAMMNTMTQRQAGQQAQIPGAVAMGGTDPYTGTRTETMQGKKLDASGDLIKNSVNQAASTARAINLLDHYEKTFKDVYGDILDKGGVEGQTAMTDKYVKGYVGKQDPKLVAFHGDLPNIVSLLQRAVSETGNIAVQKEVREGKALPVLSPNSHVSNLFMPDDPQTALAKFHGLKSQLMDTLTQNLEMAKSGNVSVAPAQGDTISSPIPGMQSQASQVKDPLEGRTATGPNGKLKRMGGKWIPA